MQVILRCSLAYLNAEIHRLLIKREYSMLRLILANAAYLRAPAMLAVDASGSRVPGSPDRKPSY
ncbi:hypothetical protein D3C71_2205080 [compost metagenome]